MFRSDSEPIDTFLFKKCKKRRKKRNDDILNDTKAAPISSLVRIVSQRSMVRIAIGGLLEQWRADTG